MGKALAAALLAAVAALAAGCAPGAVAGAHGKRVVVVNPQGPGPVDAAALARRIAREDDASVSVMEVDVLSPEAVRAASQRIVAQRPAPSAVRTAISRRRCTPRARSIAATFVAAINNTMPTAPSRSSSGLRTAPTFSAWSGATRTSSPRNTGFSATIPANTVRSSDCAEAGLAPLASRPRTRR